MGVENSQRLADNRVTLRNEQKKAHAMAEHNNIGKLGEDEAAKMLCSKGYSIVERNWTLGHLEVDIIAENRKEIVFVEVKTRTSTFGDIRPEQYVNSPKRRRITAAANAYIQQHETEKLPRFDIVGILIDRDTHEIKELTHLENAFSPRCKTIGSNSFSGVWKWHHRHKTIR